MELGAPAPVTADDVYARVLDLVQGEGLPLALACSRVGRDLDVEPALVRETALVIARREDALDLLAAPRA